MGKDRLLDKKTKLFRKRVFGVSRQREVRHDGSLSLETRAVYGSASKHATMVSAEGCRKVKGRVGAKQADG